MRKVSHLAYLFMFRSLRQAFSGKKPDVRVPHAKGLPLTDREQFGEEAESAQWIGVDLDGTLAEAVPWQGFEHIGKPVPNMVKRLTAEGVTASSRAASLIERWRAAASKACKAFNETGMRIEDISSSESFEVRRFIKHEIVAIACIVARTKFHQQLRFTQLLQPRTGRRLNTTAIHVMVPAMLNSLDDNDGLIWLDGELLPWRQARLHVLTHSLHMGGAVFEGMRAYDGHVFLNI